jgi:hypothetical protein
MRQADTIHKTAAQIIALIETRLLDTSDRNDAEAEDIATRLSARAAA